MGNTINSKTFSNLPPHYSISMNVIMYILWSWDNVNILYLIKIDCIFFIIYIKK